MDNDNRDHGHGKMEKELSAPPAYIDAERNRILKHSHDADEALKAFEGRDGQIIELDEATNRRLLRRIDWNLMPVSLRPLNRLPYSELQLIKNR